MKFTEEEIDSLFVENLQRATSVLSSLPVAAGRKPTFQGLNGWLYEQTIRFCLEEELRLLDITLPISEQFQLKGRARADLLVGQTAVEIKAGGLFGDDSEKYRKYKAITAERNLKYLYITRQETHQPYYLATKAVFGPNGAFFLSENGSWRNFVLAVAASNGPSNLCGLPPPAKQNLPVAW
jgi:hypothetical protein